jgi:hypothetical protein
MVDHEDDGARNARHCVRNTLHAMMAEERRIVCRPKLCTPSGVAQRHYLNLVMGTGHPLD